MNGTTIALTVIATLIGYAVGYRTAYRIGMKVCARLSYDAWREGFDAATSGGQSWDQPDNPYAVDGKRP